VVAGGSRRRHPLTGTDAAGFYGPASAAWARNRDAFLLLGAGPRALLLQLAHPLVAEGVSQHSDFRADPWSRLAGTLRSYLRVIYASRAGATAEISRLNRLHRTITGVVEDPEARAVTGVASYAARDPGLSLWVHATLVESTLAVNEAWRGSLPPGEAERFYVETLPIARAFGIPDAILPADLAAFRAWWAAMLAPGGPIRVTQTARKLAATILAPPLAPLAGEGSGGVMPAGFRPILAAIPPGAIGWLMWPSIALLPASIRAGYEIPWSPLRGAVATWLVAGWRCWAALLPDAWGTMPQARAADRRIASAFTEHSRAR
jgi:uncharacterized protein (DUF2236 family)